MLKGKVKRETDRFSEHQEGLDIGRILFLGGIFVPLIIFVLFMMVHTQTSMTALEEEYRELTEIMSPVKEIFVNTGETVYVTEGTVTVVDGGVIVTEANSEVEIMREELADLESTYTALVANLIIMVVTPCYLIYKEVNPKRVKEGEDLETYRGGTVKEV